MAIASVVALGAVAGFGLVKMIREGKQAFS
jgi:hypothetical protein